MKLAIALIVALSAASFASAQSTTRPLGSIVTVSAVRHIVGLDAIKRNENGKLTVQDGVLEFKTTKAEDKVPVSSIDDIFIGTESTQARGTKATVAKTAAIAAPFESGRALTILMRTKVDIMTISFHDSDGALHGAIFALPVGQGEQTRAQLIEAGAHASPVERADNGK